MRYIKGKGVFFLVLCTLQLTAVRALAEGPVVVAADSAVTIDGTVLTCTSCRAIDDERCAIRESGEDVVMPCSDALLKLLVQARTSANVTFSVAELRRYLLGTNATLAGATAALQLLLATDQGRKAAARDMTLYYSRYAGVLTERICESPINGDVWEPLWLLAREDVVHGASVRGALLACHDEYTVSRLFSELSVVNVAADRRALEEVLAVVRGKSAVKAAEIDRALSMLTACENLEAQEGCSAASLAPLEVEVQDYLHRVQMRALIAWGNSQNPGLEQVLIKIAGTEYRRFTTPQLYALVRETLLKDAVTQYPGTSQTAQLAYRERELLREFAQHDPELAMLLEPRPTISWSIGVLSGGAIVGIVVGVWLFCRRRSTKAQPTLPADQRSELRVLRRYFQLPANSSETDLKRQFRSRAQVLHPDRERSSSIANPTGQDFSELTEKYQRARKLLRHAEKIERNRRYH